VKKEGVVEVRLSLWMCMRNVLASCGHWGFWDQAWSADEKLETLLTVQDSVIRGSVCMLITNSIGLFEEWSWTIS